MEEEPGEPFGGSDSPSDLFLSAADLAYWRDPDRWLTEEEYAAAQALEDAASVAFAAAAEETAPGPDPLMVAEESVQVVAATTARLWVSFAEAIAEARRTPWEWVPCPVGHDGPRQRDFAERAVVADLATRLRIPEGTVRTQAHRASIARARVPQVWRRFTLGLTSARHLEVAVDASAGLEGDPLERFDAQAAEWAVQLSASRLSPRVRLLAERLNPTSLTVRRVAAQERRGVWVEPGRDGMAWLSAHLPAETTQRAMAYLTAAATALACPDESRTRDQLRADVLGDVLTGRGTTHEVTATVAVTVPVMTLLGRDEQPATLDGWVPVDADTARRAVAAAPSLGRILTDPITSAVIDVDRHCYRVPAELKRLIRAAQVECTHPGCRRPAAECDIDHLLAWADHGVTALANLHPACPSHHKLKHHTRWKVAKASSGKVTWTSPSGNATDADPPPF